MIKTALVRSPTITIDPVTQREIDELCAQIVPTAVSYQAVAA